MVLYKENEEIMTHVDDIETQKANMKYIRSSMKEPILERGYEFELARRWRDENDERALHELVQSYTRLVVSMASKFRNYGLPMGDLIQEGNIGLMQAAGRFDPDREIRFSTYASWWIRSSIQDYVLRNWSVVRTGTTAAQKSLFFNFRRLRAKIEGKMGLDEVTQDVRDEIAKELKVSIQNVEEMETRLFSNDQSLNAPVAEGEGAEWQSFLADERPNPEDVVTVMKDSSTRSAWLSLALGELNDRERKIIRDRHLGYKTVTLEELGKDLGISKERVRQLESRAMNKLKDSITEKVGAESVSDML